MSIADKKEYNRFMKRRVCKYMEKREANGRIKRTDAGKNKKDVRQMEKRRMQEEPAYRKKTEKISVL